MGQMHMLRVTPAILLIFMTAIGNGLATANETQGYQAELDAACETARQAALAPSRSEIYQECIEKFKKSAVVCEEEAAGYNGNRVGRSPLFYDLPECVAAFENR
jgi:hypothetical protein